MSQQISRVETSAGPALASFGNVVCAPLRFAVAFGLGIAAAATLPAAALPGYTITAARGATTAVRLNAPPNALCMLQAMNSRAGRPLTAFSNSRGVVSYFVTVPPNARTGDLATVECRNANRHTIDGVTVLLGAPAAARPIVPVRRATIEDLATNARMGVLPGTPTGFDVTSASDAQLARLGYPMRPDQRIHPYAYTIWRKLVTTPGAYITAGGIVNPEVRGPASRSTPRATRRGVMAGTSFTTVTSSNWSGDVIDGQPAAFDDVLGAWTVPSVSTDGNFGGSYSSTWVGIDGWGNNDVVQDGTEQDATGFGPWGQWTIYYAWYEFFPNQQVAMSNVSVSPGDQILAESFTGYDSTGTLNGYYWLYDYTSNQGAFTNAAIPAGASFAGASAEWIEERTTVNNALYPMPDYGNVQMSSTEALTNDGNVYHADGSNAFGAGDSQLNVIMTSNGLLSGDWLSEGYDYGPNNVGFHYLGWI